MENKDKIINLILRNRFLAKTIYFLTGKPPSMPQIVGFQHYRQRGLWKLQLDICPCDGELVEYLEKNQIYSQSIFHFGTGYHHLLGIENQKFDKPNEIFAITACVKEHEAYIKLCNQDHTIAKYYKVLYGDIYTLTEKSLSKFDLISLFHVGEFYLPEEANFIHHNDRSLVNLFLNRLNDGGKILFYTKSLGWEQTKAIIQDLESQKKIHLVDQYKTLLIYEK